MQQQKMKNVNMDKENKKEKEKEKEKQNNSDNEQSETEAGSTKEIILYKNLLKDIAGTLNSIISENKKMKKQKKENSPFSREHAPKISLFDYLLRIQKYSGIENSTLILSLIYIDRICSKKGIVLTKYNIHRLLFTAILISIKYNEDVIYDNSFFSKIGGITLHELVVLENEFLKIIDFELFVSDEVYQKYYEYLNYNKSHNNE